MNVSEIINVDDNDDNNNNIVLEVSPLFLLISIIPCVFSIICVLSFSMFKFIKILINR